MKNAIIRALTLGLALSFSTATVYAQEAGGEAAPAKKEKKAKGEKTEKTEKTDKKTKKEKKDDAGKAAGGEKPAGGGW